MIMLRNQHTRKVVLQAVYVLVLLAILITGVFSAQANMAAQGLELSFSFLWKATGWDMTFSLLPTSSSDPYWWYLVSGVVNTLFLGIIGLAGATLVGGVVGFARISSNHGARLLGTVYVELFRNIPVIVQIFFWYALANHLPSPRRAIEFGGALISNRGIYMPGMNVEGLYIALFYFVLCAYFIGLIWFVSARRFRRVDPAKRRKVVWGLSICALAIETMLLYIGKPVGEVLITYPELKGLNVQGGYRIQTEVYTLAFAIAIYGGAYIGEIVRGGFNAVGRGQHEAARALGLSTWQEFSRIRLPLALRAMLPILTNQYVWLVKATTLGIVAGFSDFFMVIASSITHSGQTLEFIGILMGGFLVINFTISSVMNKINKAVALKGHQLRM
ncbi:ABC transporter permease subunit [Marinomonas communis]|uniref:General L-amino acid transport system permease protein n=1 Tax=Marinomonas communis TaxID=28254 RepID=A0A4R6X0X6_9GAMM|nr:ABC transporter permease subunit [Marinomonas communis]TDR12492.1 general L-amino acid transport system permease protein [Marinomonas communis]